MAERSQGISRAFLQQSASSGFVGVALIHLEVHLRRAFLPPAGQTIFRGEAKSGEAIILQDNFLARFVVCQCLHVTILFTMKHAGDL